jgi:hypothetical protein
VFYNLFRRPGTNIKGSFFRTILVSYVYRVPVPYILVQKRTSILCALSQSVRSGIPHNFKNIRLKYEIFLVLHTLSKLSTDTFGS